MQNPLRVILELLNVSHSIPSFKKVYKFEINEENSTDTQLNGPTTQQIHSI